MRLMTDLQKLTEGKNWLRLLKEDECPNFHCFTGYILNALSKGYYAEDELGATVVDVLNLAHNHAANAARTGYPAVVARMNEYRGLIAKELGANKPPLYVTEDNVITLSPSLVPRSIATVAA